MSYVEGSNSCRKSSIFGDVSRRDTQGYFSLSGYFGWNIGIQLAIFPIGIFSLETGVNLGYLPAQKISMTYLDAHTFGQTVRTARKAQGLRQNQLAGAAGVGVRFIVDLEAGKPTAQLEKALKVAATLGIVITIGEGKP